MKVPFVDLYAQYLDIKKDIDSAIENTIRTSAYIGGPAVKEFEKAFAAWVGVDHVVACGNGTDSIEILLKAYGVGAGDEVIVPAISWISTSEAVGAVGATPVFVDIEEDYFAIDATRVEAAITKNTKAIIPVHLYGHPADMPAIMAIATKHRLVVIEDCAQSHGARIDGKAAGTFGHAASFSFYPGKNLGAYGDAGCMATNDPAIAEQVRMIAQHGQKGKHNHLIEGRNSRLDGLQAAILLAKLPHLDSWTDRRIANAAHYDKVLKGGDFCIPKVRPGSRHVYHLYVIRTKNRAAVQEKLEKAGIETAIHYPTPLPFLPCYAHFGHKPEDFPVAASCRQTILSIPMFAELTPQQMDHVAFVLKESHA